MTSLVLAVAIYFQPTRHKDGPWVYDARTSIQAGVDTTPRPLLQLRP